MKENPDVRTIKLLTILTTILILYNTLIPFKPYLELWKIVRQIHRIEWVPFIVDGRFNPLTDLVGNVLLFMPFGFFLTLYFIYTNRKHLTGRIVLLGMLFSMSIEILQIGFRYRTPSTTDVIMNTLGTAIGVLGAKIYVKYLAVRTKIFLENILRNEPITLILLLIIAVQFFGSALPFNVTITVSDLKKAVAYTNIQPFGMKPLGLLLGAHIKNPERFVFSWTDFMANVIFYAIYGYLVFYAYFQYWRSQSYGKLLLFALAVLYFPALEITQFFIKSRFSDINDVISGYGGLIIGGLLFALVKKDEWFTHNTRIEIKHFYVPLLLYLFYVFYKSYNPFNFTLDAQALELNFRIRYLVPFYAYYKVTSLWNIYDLLESLFMLMPAGFLLGYFLSEKYSFNKIEKVAIISGIVWGSVLEAGQLFLPSRTGEITDVIVMTIGCFVGARLYAYYYEKFVQPSAFVQSLIKENAR